MTPTRWLLPERVFDGRRLRSGVAIGLLEDRVAAVQDLAELPRDVRLDRIEGLVSPGFVDLQVNGGGGVLFNKTPTVDAMAAIAAAHHRLGTVAILPTLITDSPEVLAHAVDAAIAGIGTPGIAGIHIEGPHIALDRRGTHAARFVRPFAPETLGHVQRLRAAGVPVMITLAPEAADHQAIAALAATGAVVSIGHTDATAETVRAALSAGAGCFTHLFNAMSPMLNRAPGVTGAAIASDAHAGIICDGIHVDDTMVGIAIRARPKPDRMFLVSDAMPTVGGPDRFSLYGMEIRLRDGRLVNEEGSLAGAHVTLAESVARLVHVVGRPLEEALRMAVTVPAQLIGRDDLARIEGRDTRDLVHLAPDLSFRGMLDSTAATVRQPG
jgi:N-acetylglucosamine-6-phosphate deacetylase